MYVWEVSVGNAVHGSDAGEIFALPLQSSAAVHFSVPIGETADVESIPALRHQGHVYNIAEVLIGGCEFFDGLRVGKVVLVR